MILRICLTEKIGKCSIFRPGGHSHTLPIQVCAANGVMILKLLIWNGLSLSEVFSRTGYNISNAWKFQFCKQPFEVIQGQIAFKNAVQFTNVLERSIKNWPISTTGYEF